MSADTSSLPSELITTPLPLIGLSGLDVDKNPIHKSVLESFINNRKPDRAQIQFKLLPPNYEFPVSKPKRQTYEWYNPKGILKRNWMLKHLHVLPAVVVLFQDIEWNDPQWSEKLLHCASVVQSLKNSLQGRNTKIAVVLLQKDSPIPSTDVIAVERSANLTSKCDITSKMLFVLSINEHLMGMSPAFVDFGQSYYKQMTQQVRVHRDQLTTSHQFLKIRHQFKLGFIAEMRFDYSAALKHYSQAYVNLEEIRVVDTNCLEMKTVAGFLNYKMCKLMFRLNAPRDAITQFKSHIERFRTRTGFKELIFEHFGWLSAQYSAFADLFCDAIKIGLPALQTQHPGLYFHKSAEYLGKRKEAFQQCCAQSHGQVLDGNQLSNIFWSDFFGVRGTKLSEPMNEQQMIIMVQETEKSFNHSAAIITQLSKAMAQFKHYKCPRFRKKLAIDMAEEYLKCGDFSKSLTLYSLMLSDYRDDMWYPVFTEVLLKTLQSAFLAASVADFFACSIEALSPKINLNKSDRIVVLENLWKVFQNVPPISPSQTAPQLKSQWESALSNFKPPIVIDMDRMSELLECIVTFDSPQCKLDETIELQLFLRSKTEVPLKLRSFSLWLTDSNLNYKLTTHSFVEVKSNAESNPKAIDADFMVEPNKCYKFQFTANEYRFVENTELSILRLEIVMGADKHYAVLTQSSALRKVKNFKSYNPHDDSLESVHINSSCYIVPTFHLTTQNSLCNQPMLVNEYFKSTAVITNSFDLALQKVGVSITVPPNLRNKVFITVDLSKTRQKLYSQIQIDVGDLQMNTSVPIQYYVVSLIGGNIELHQKLWYQIDNIQSVNASTNMKSDVIVDSPVHKEASKPSLQHNKSHNMNIEYIDDGVRKVKEDTIIIPCVEEFTVRGRFFTLNKQAMVQGFRNEDFLFRVDLEVKAWCDIDILDMFLICDHNLIEKPYSKQRRKFTVPYKTGQTIKDIKILHANKTTAQWVSANHLQNADKENLLFQRIRNIDRPAHENATFPAHNAEKDDRFKSNLLSKIPINSTIVPNLMNTSQNRSFADMVKGKSSDLLTSSFNENIAAKDDAKTALISKTIYNKAIDSFQLTDYCRGFLRDGSFSEMNQTLPVFGVYCVRWRRSGCTEENETKLIVQGIEIVESPLNIHCCLDDKMYVKVPMTLKITLVNPTVKAMRLRTSMKNSENFMISGNTQLNISIYSRSSFDLSFNLYPLKAGWQELPEFEIRYNNTPDDEPNVDANAELQSLVDRWMPKKVFILPMLRHSK
ncbi:hypothetical protein HA402_002865 [Bradysia odoriphaga]|nr:hypothetical protein HA402_002865 [Bradysia odoriphaga]